MAPAIAEPSLKYHPEYALVLTPSRESGRGTVLSGQFDWGGLLLKSNGVPNSQPPTYSTHAGPKPNTKLQ